MVQVATVEAGSVHSITPGKWVRGAMLMPIFGITQNVAKKYRLAGRWLEGVHFQQKGPREYWYCVPAIEKWVETNG